MSRVHETRQAGEMAFMESSGSLDWYNNPVFFMCTHHPCGALSLWVWVTSSQSQLSWKIQIHSVKSCSQKGPDIFMIDDDTGQRQALRVHWQQATLLLCIFHFLQATWRWLLDSKALHFKGWQITPDVHNAGPCVCQNPTRIWRDCTAVVGEGPVTPFLCGGIPLTFGGIH